MLEKFKGSFWKRSPAVVVAGGILVVAVVAGTVLLLTKGNSKADASIQPVAARIDQIDGSVGIARVKADDQELDWTEANVNMPVTVGDRIYSRDLANASIALTGRNYVRLNPNTTLDVLTLTPHRTQLALRGGSGLFDVGALSGDDFFEVATPCGAVDFREPGLYQIGMDGDNAIISVLSGAAQVVGLGGSGYVSKGEVYTLFAQAAAEAAAATLAPDAAGEIVDGYYRHRYPRIYDGRYRNYDAYLADPYFYDPYRTSVSYQYLPVDVPGLYDLDYYGDWIDVSGYGHCWAPRVSTGWAPFRNGYWDLDDLWGPSWVSYEPWGWAPYHYGRWAFISQRWYWVPVEVRTNPVYCPAPVAFIPFQDQIAWVPLGPGEVYVARYYDEGLRPRFLASREVINVVSVRNTFVNFDAPGGVTVVPVRSLASVIQPSALSTVDLRAVREARSVIDPFSVAGVRELALRREDARRRLKLTRIDNEDFRRPVVTSNTPEDFRVRSDIGKALRVESVPENQRKNKLKVEQTGVVSSLRADGLPLPTSVGSQRRNELASRAEQGDKSARRELRQMMRQEQRQSGQPGGQSPATGQPPDQSRKEMRQQRRAEQQQQQSAQQEQTRQQRKVERQLQRQSTQQAQQDQMRQQRRAEQQRQQSAQQDAARRAQQQHQQQQMRQQRRVERQQPPRQPQQPQTRQQRKEQKRKPPDDSAQLRQLRQRQRARQQEASRQAQAGWQREQVTPQRRVELQRQAAMIQQQQAVRVQESGRQQRQAARAQAAQREAMVQQQAARARESQRQALIQQQEARAQAPNRAARAPAPQQFSGQQVQQSRDQRKAEKAQRKHPQ
ncbi:MAG TPA: DUF6600 domain-containing protein [Blastocatellia bacterium]|nr:DUF6600 domain-containing protein [Blastocatellia bacterium]